MTTRIAISLSPDSNLVYYPSLSFIYPWHSVYHGLTHIRYNIARLSVLHVREGIQTVHKLGRGWHMIQTSVL